MPQSDAAGNTGQLSASAPLEGKVSQDEIIRGPLQEGQRQPWWPEGVNSEAELAAWTPTGKENAVQDPAPATEEPKAAETKTDEPKADEPKADADKPPVRTDDEIRAALKDAGGVYADPKYEPYAIEVERNGTLSPESITKAAADFGVPEDYVKAFVDGQKASREVATLKASSTETARMTAQAQVVLGVFKGDNVEADYKAFQEWGNNGGLSATEQQAYNSALERGDTTTQGALLAAYHAKFQLAGGTVRRDITDTSTDPAKGQDQGVKPFASLAEGRAAMASRRYQNDPGFRAEVDARYVITE